MKMMDMEEETHGIIAQLKNEGYNEGFDECKQSVLDYLSESPSIEEISIFLKNLSLKC